jgi:hypothetical protein
MDFKENIPVLIGYINKKIGFKGFEEAEIGHPVFEVKDLYVVFLRSEVMLSEREYNPKTGGHEQKKYFYDAAFPFYKKTLFPFIEFIETAKLVV